MRSNSNEMQGLYEKYREIFVYLIVGGMTTIVSWIVAYLGRTILDTGVSWENMLNNTLSWIAGVLLLIR